MADDTSLTTDISTVPATVRLVAGYLVTNALTYAAAKGLIPASSVGDLATYALACLPFIVAVGHIFFVYFKKRTAPVVVVAPATPATPATVIVTPAAPKA